MKSKNQKQVQWPDFLKNHSWGFIFCTAPETQILNSLESFKNESPATHWVLVGSDSSPLKSGEAHEFTSWGSGPFTVKTGLQLFKSLKGFKPNTILLPLNNKNGEGYFCLRFFSQIMAKEAVWEFPKEGSKRLLTWKKFFQGFHIEEFVYSGLMKILDLFFPLFYFWLKPKELKTQQNKENLLEPKELKQITSNIPPEVSIIIRTFNEEKFIGQTLEKILKQNEVHPEIIIIDSTSTDKTIEIAQTFPVRIYQITKESFHYAAVLNLGAQLAQSEILINLSAHAVPASDSWLKNLIEPLKENSDLCGVFGRELPIPNWSSWFEKKLLNDTFSSEPIVRHNDFFFSNANSAIPKSLLLENPFDQNVDWGEDQEWVHRMQKKGYKTYYQPLSPVFHSHNLSIKECFSRTLKFQQMLFQRMFRNHAKESILSSRKQLPGRAESFRKFIFEKKGGNPLWAFVYSPWCEYMNYLGCEIAYRESRSLTRIVKPEELLQKKTSQSSVKLKSEVAN